MKSVTTRMEYRINESISHLSERAGIYALFNISSGIYYIGSTKDLYRRLMAHRYQLKKKTHFNSYLQEDYNNKDIFIFKIIEFISDNDILHLIDEERYYINLYNNSNIPIYNINLIEKDETKERDQKDEKINDSKIIGSTNETILREHELYNNIEISLNIKNIICKKFSIDSKQLISKNRKSKFVEARHIAMYLCRKYTEYSLPEIGRLFGDRDHTTVIYACNKIEEKIENNSIYTNLIKSLESEIIKDLKDC